MKFFIDTADVQEIREANALGVLDGVTTNPSLVAKSGRKFIEVLKEITEIRATPVSDAELSDAKSFLTGSFPLRLETGARIANFLIAVEYYGLGTDYIDKYPSYINSVTKEDVLRVAKKYIDPEDFIIVIVADLNKAGLKKDRQ